MYSLIYSLEFYVDGYIRGFTVRIGAFNQEFDEFIGVEEDFSYKNSDIVQKT